MEYLESSIESLTRTNDNLSHSIAQFSNSTSDFGRLSTVLSQSRVFYTVPECDIGGEENFDKLSAVIDDEILRFEKRIEVLKQKIQLQDDRINNDERLKFLRDKKARLQELCNGV